MRRDLQDRVPGGARPIHRRVASVVSAKRLESEADTDGILVSDVVRKAVAGKDFEFDDRGEVGLKGFDQPVRAWVVSWE